MTPQNCWWQPSRARPSASGDGDSIDGSAIDSPFVTSWRSQGHRNWLHSASLCRQRCRRSKLSAHHSSTHCLPEQVRLRGSHAQRSHGRGPECDDSDRRWHRCTSPRVAVSDAGETRCNASCTIVVAIRPDVVCSTVLSLVVR